MLCMPPEKHSAKIISFSERLAARRAPQAEKQEDDNARHGEGATAVPKEALLYKPLSNEELFSLTYDGLKQRIDGLASAQAAQGEALVRLEQRRIELLGEKSQRTAERDSAAGDEARYEQLCATIEDVDRELEAFDAELREQHDLVRELSEERERTYVRIISHPRYSEEQYALVKGK